MAWPNSRAWARARAEGDGNVAEEARARSGLDRLSLSTGWEGEHVGGVILAAEVAVQAAEFGVAGDQSVEGAVLGDFLLEACGRNVGSGARRKVAGTRRNVTLLPSGDDMAALQAWVAASADGISTLTSPFPFSAGGTGSASGRVSCRAAPIASL